MTKTRFQHLTMERIGELTQELNRLTTVTIRERYPLMLFGPKATKATMINAVLTAADKEAAELAQAEADKPAIGGVSPDTKAVEQPTLEQNKPVEAEKPAPAKLSPEERQAKIEA